MLVEPTLMTDEVIRDIRRVRHEISKQCAHDPHRVVAYYRRFQEELKRTGAYRFWNKPGEIAEASKTQSGVNASVGT